MPCLKISRLLAVSSHWRKKRKKKLMFDGAFPSARFEKRNGLLIPTANNLSPFGKEDYFDGQQIRKQASREVLEEDFFSKLNLLLIIYKKALTLAKEKNIKAKEIIQNIILKQLKVFFNLTKKNTKNVKNIWRLKKSVIFVL